MIINGTHIFATGNISAFSKGVIEKAKKTKECPKCGRLMEYGDDFNESFSDEYNQSGGEHLYCNCCDIRIDL